MNTECFITDLYYIVIKSITKMWIMRKCSLIKAENLRSFLDSVMEIGLYGMFQLHLFAEYWKHYFLEKMYQKSFQLVTMTTFKIVVIHDNQNWLIPFWFVFENMKSALRRLSKISFYFVLNACSHLSTRRRIRPFVGWSVSPFHR